MRIAVALAYGCTNMLRVTVQPADGENFGGVLLASFQSCLSVCERARSQLHACLVLSVCLHMHQLSQHISQSDSYTPPRQPGQTEIETPRCRRQVAMLIVQPCLAC
ncbi:hypothetical protein J3E68DRAFT_407484 [Trichoderma sp. SZMC 28012]